MIGKNDTMGKDLVVWKCLQGTKTFTSVIADIDIAIALQFLKTWLDLRLDSSTKENKAINQKMRITQNLPLLKLNANDLECFGNIEANIRNWIGSQSQNSWEHHSLKMRF